MNTRIRFLFLFIFSLIISCTTPPSDMQPINVITWLHALLPKLNEVNLNEQKQKNFITNEIQNKKELLVFYQGQTIRLHTKKQKNSELIDADENNSFILKKPVYLTYEKKETYLSFDGENWILFKPFNTQSNFIMDYQFESILSDKMIDIYFTASAKLKNNLKNLIKLSVKKPIKSLQSEMILADSKNKESLSIDLNKTILYIPADTILSGSVNISGNIFKNQTGADFIDITPLKNIYIYLNKTMLNFSFNRDKWDMTLQTLLSIKFSPNLIIKSTDQKRIHFNLDVDLTIHD